MTYRLAVVSAGIGEPSSTRLLAERLAQATGQALGGQAEIHVVALRDLAHEVANAVLTGFPAGALREAVDTVVGADALIAVTPIFNASYSGLFKSFFDVLEPDSLAGKPVLIGATGGTPRHSLALEHALRPLFAYLRAAVVPTAVYAAAEDWGGQLTDRIGLAGGELANLVAGTPKPVRQDPYENVVPFEQLLAGNG
ncbi:FMN reductase [Kutzneria albida]|uniref:NADPH-dependent FMN reductase-like domain-containing protein n=1 Tax=Kutzneria albida DSM 43870 TaxID=1449976 RepID=W5WEX3_9PSEU|nr:FMN reductase [Kutzneria albida]AHH99402.1 hypothetical protein KALB_6042 [Kutzneria albida DSM 43870]